MCAAAASALQLVQRRSWMDVHRCSSGTENLIILFMIIIQCAVCYRWRWRHSVPALSVRHLHVTRSFHRYRHRRLSISSRTWHLSVSLACIQWLCVCWCAITSICTGIIMIGLSLRCQFYSFYAFVSSSLHLCANWTSRRNCRWIFCSYSALAWCAFYTRW